MSDSLRAVVEQQGAVATLRLARPEGRNGIDMEMARSLQQAADDIEALDGVRALLVRADGPAFTVGGDLAHIAGETDDLAGHVDAMIAHYHDALARLGTLPYPVVAAVQGAAAGGGLGLMWIADVVVAADDLRIATGFARLGLSGDGGSSWILPRLVGARRARQLTLGGRVLDAEEALEWGLVDRVVAAADLAAEAEAEAARWAAGPTLAYAEMKQLLARASTRTWEEGLQAETAAMHRTAASADAPDGIRAFVDKRAPEFRGH